MNIKIKKISQAETDAWDTYINAHPNATLYHLSALKNIIEKTYGHKTYYLIAEQQPNNPSNLITQNPTTCLYT